MIDLIEQKHHVLTFERSIKEDRAKLLNNLQKHEIELKQEKAKIHSIESSTETRVKKQYENQITELKRSLHRTQEELRVKDVTVDEIKNDYEKRIFSLKNRIDSAGTK